MPETLPNSPSPMSILDQSPNHSEEAPAEPKTLDDFFKIHPLERTAEIVKSIIDGLISQRHEWDREQSTAKTNGTRAKRVTAKKITPKPESNIDLDDLLADI